MIPSRPLSFADIFSETFAITARAFPRYVLLFLVCIIPPMWLMTEGVIEATQTVFHIAQRHYNFTDDDLTALRNIFRDSLARDNPAFRTELQSIEEDRQVRRDSLGAIARDSMKQGDGALVAEASDTVITDTSVTITTTTRNAADSLLTSIRGRSRVHLSQVIEEHIGDIINASAAFFIGFLLHLIGYSVLLAGITELGVQAFEARRQRLGYTFKRIFQHHLWTVLAIYLLYGLAAFGLWVLAVIIGEIRYAGPLIDAGLFVFWIFASLGLSLAIPISVSENRGPIESFQRSWKLTNGSKLRILGTGIVLSVIIVGITLFLSVVTSALFMGMSLEFWRHVMRDPVITVNWVLNGITQLIESSMLANTVTWFFTMSLPMVFLVVFYYDLRTRLEGPLTYDEAPAAPQPTLWQP
jgi:hypothetical protein